MLRSSASLFWQKCCYAFQQDSNAFSVKIIVKMVKTIPNPYIMVLISTFYGDFQKRPGYPHSTNEDAEE